MNILSEWQPKIQAEIQTILAEAAEEFSEFSLDRIQIGYLQQLATKGKQFRGCLLVGLYRSVLGGEIQDKRSLLRLAAAIELYGTGILIHDDVIDRSDQRRGIPSVHQYMEERAKTDQLKEAAHFGISSAICLADFLYFIADNTVAELEFSPQLRLTLAAINGSELARLGLAEIEDVRLSFCDQPISRTEIIDMYIGKTGRYTGRWPLLLAATVAGLSTKSCQSLAKVGEKIGLLYQLKDDELGIFGDPEKIGKSVTSDLVAGKKTLYYYYLKQDLSLKQQLSVFKIIGNSEATLAQLDEVKSLITTTGIRQKVSTEMTALKLELLIDISKLELPTQAMVFLDQIVDFAVSRSN